MNSEAMAFTNDELRVFAADMLAEHDPVNQGHTYERCELCHYTRHPCDVFDLASATLKLLAEGSDDEQ